MSANNCSGKIEYLSHEWFCHECGHTSTRWDTQHEPMQTRDENLLDCLAEVLAVELTA